MVVSYHSLQNVFVPVTWQSLANAVFILECKYCSLRCTQCLLHPVRGRLNGRLTCDAIKARLLPLRSGRANLHWQVAQI